MTHEFSIGDIIRLNGTKQEAEILELIEDDFRGELLRIKLLAVPAGVESILFYPPQLVEMVRPGASEHPRPGKKILT